MAAAWTWRSGARAGSEYRVVRCPCCKSLRDVSPAVRRQRVGLFFPSRVEAGIAASVLALTFGQLLQLGISRVGFSTSARASR